MGMEAPPLLGNQTEREQRRPHQDTPSSGGIRPPAGGDVENLACERPRPRRGPYDACNPAAIAEQVPLDENRIGQLGAYLTRDGVAVRVHEIGSRAGGVDDRPPCVFTG